MDFSSGLSGEDIFKFEEQFLLFPDEVLFGFNFFSLGNKPSKYEIKITFVEFVFWVFFRNCPDR